MSNTDFIRDFYDAFRSDEIERFEKLCDPEIEWIQNEGFPYGGRHKGAAAVLENVRRELARRWDDWSFAIEDILDAGGHVVVIGDYAGRHKETGKAFKAAAAHVFDLKDGRVSRFRQFTDTALVRDATL